MAPVARITTGDGARIRFEGPRLCHPPPSKRPDLAGRGDPLPHHRRQPLLLARRRTGPVGRRVQRGRPPHPVQGLQQTGRRDRAGGRRAAAVAPVCSLPRQAWNALAICRGPGRRRRAGRSSAAGCGFARRPRGNAWCRAHGRAYAAAVARRKRRGCRPVPDPGVLLAQLRSPDEQVRVKALHRVCPCGAGFLVYERFRGEVKRLQKDPNLRVRAAALHAEQDACLIEELDGNLDQVRGAGLAVQRRGLGAGETPPSGDPVLAAAVTAAGAAICSGRP
jgi:hypothetical protein